MRGFRRTQSVMDLAGGRTMRHLISGSPPRVSAKELHISSFSGSEITGSDGVVRRKVGDRVIEEGDIFIAMNNKAIVGTAPKPGRFVPGPSLGTRNVLAVITWKSIQLGRLELYDLTIPAEPEFLGSVEHRDLRGAEAIVAKDTNVFILNQIDKIIVSVDVSDPETPRIVGKTGAFFVTSWDMVIEENYIYLVNLLPQEILVVDVSLPSAPQVITRVDISAGLGALPTPGTVHVGGGYLWVGDIYTFVGVKGYSLSDPTRPVVDSAQFVLLTSTVLGLAFKGDKYLLISAPDHDSVYFTDITNDQIGWAREDPELKNVDRIVVSEDMNYAYVHVRIPNPNVDDPSYFSVIDITDPFANPSHPHPVFLASIRDDVKFGAGGHWIKMSVLGTMVYVCGFDYEMVTIVDASAPASPAIVRTVTVQGHPHGTAIIEVDE